MKTATIKIITTLLFVALFAALLPFTGCQSANVLHMKKHKGGNYLNAQAKKRKQIQEYLTAQAKENRNF